MSDPPPAAAGARRLSSRCPGSPGRRGTLSDAARGGESRSSSISCCGRCRPRGASRYSSRRPACSMRPDGGLTKWPRRPNRRRIRAAAGPWASRYLTRRAGNALHLETGMTTGRRYPPPPETSRPGPGPPARPDPDGPGRGAARPGPSQPYSIPAFATAHVRAPRLAGPDTSHKRLVREVSVATYGYITRGNLIPTTRSSPTKSCRVSGSGRRTKTNTRLPARSRDHGRLGWPRAWPGCWNTRGRRCLVARSRRRTTRGPAQRYGCSPSSSSSSRSSRR